MGASADENPTSENPTPLIRAARRLMADDHGAADLVHEQQWSHLPWAADGATMSEFEASCQDALRSCA